MSENSYNREREDVLHDVTEEVHDAEEKPCAAEEEEQVITSEWFKENTSLLGWLIVFLFVVVAGSLFSLFHNITRIHPEEYGYNGGAMFADALLCFALVAIAIYTVYLFVQRRPNAVFYGQVYVVYILLSNLLALLLALLTDSYDDTLTFIARQTLRVIMDVILLIYLYDSFQVEEVIPKSFRKVYKRDWGIVIVLVCLPLILTVVGACQQICY